MTRVLAVVVLQFVSFHLVANSEAKMIRAPPAISVGWSALSCSSATAKMVDQIGVVENST